MRAVSVRITARGGVRAALAAALLCLWAGALVSLGPRSVRALGDDTRVALTGLALGNTPEPLPTARRRLAWEVHRRTSVETIPAPARVHPTDASFFESPLLYFAAERAFDPPSEDEASALRRFLQLGGMLILDDSSGGEAEGVDTSMRALVHSILPGESLSSLPTTHPIYHSFYVLDRPVGRVRGPRQLEAIVRDGRAAIVYSRHDLGGAWARDNLGAWQREVIPGGDIQRERAIRLGVNLVVYALCLDYKDDQVHAPFLMRRRGGAPLP